MSLERSRQLYAAALTEYAPDRIIGIDEVGVGAWAGPVYVCGVSTFPDFTLPGLRDSKKVLEKARPQLCTDILAVPGLEPATAFCSSQCVDMLGIAHAVAKLTLSAIELVTERIITERCLIVVDGDRQPPRSGRYPQNYRVLAIPKADDIVPAVMAASNLAKLLRDKRMREIEAGNPELYGPFAFAKNKGYGTEQHRLALKRLQPTDQHRLSYRPVRQALTYGKTV